jgi:hypothetical protein
VTRTYERGTATRSTPIPGIQSSPSRVNRFARSGGGTAAHGLHDLVAVAGPATRCGRERIPTTAESAIRARFVRDSFHRLSTELITALSRRIVWYRRRRAAVKKRAGACWMFRAISINERCNRAGCRVAGRNRILSAREDEPSRQSDPAKGWWTCRTSLALGSLGAGSRVAACQMPWRARRCVMAGGRAKPVLPSWRFLPTRTASVADRCDLALSGGASLAVFTTTAGGRGSSNCNLDHLLHFGLE